VNTITYKRKFIYPIFFLLSVILFSFIGVNGEEHSVVSPDSAYLVLSDSVFNFGDVTYNRPYYLPLWIYNYGTDTLFIDSLGFPLSDDSLSLQITYLSSRVTRDTIAGGSSKRWQVRFFPFEEKTYRDTITIYSSAYNEPVKRLYVTGYADPADISTMTDDFDFGRVILNTSVQENFLIYNDGASDLVVSDITFGNPAFSVDETSFTIDPSIIVARNVTVTFHPDQLGNYVDTMTISSSDFDEPEFKVVFRGEGAIPVLTLMQDTLNFGDCNKNSTTQMRLPMRNAGNYNLTIDSMVWGDTTFSISGSTEVITPDSQSGLYVSFTPDSLKNYSDTLRIYSDNYEVSVTYLYLTGTGVMPLIDSTEFPVNFSNVTLYTSKKDSVLVKNEGSGTMELSGFYHNGPDSIFSYNDSARTISPGDSIYISVEFTPYSRSTYYDTIIAETNVSDADSLYFFLRGIGTAPLLSLNATTIDFDSVTVPGDSTINDTLINSGNALLQITGVNVSGNTFETGIQAGTTVGSNESLFFSVTFSPDYGESHADSIVITSNDPDNPRSVIYISGTGSAAEMITSMMTINFGDTTADSTVYDTLAIINDGTINLEITDINFAKQQRGSQHTLLEELSVYNAFAVNDTDMTIIPGDTAFLQVSFVPESDVGYFDTLVVVSNTNTSTYSRIALRGNPGKNFYPEILTMPETIVYEDQLYSYTVYATDFDGDAVRYSLASSPEDMIIDSISGLIEWTPLDKDADSTFSIVLYAEDGSTGIDSQKYSLRVIEVNASPQVMEPPDSIVYLGQTYSYQMVVQDEENDPFTFQPVSYPYHPAKMNISQSGLITWTPVLTGTYYVSMKIRDDRGGNTDYSFNIHVLEYNDPPQFSSIADTVIYEDVPFQKNVTAADTDNDVLTYSLTESPSDMTINSSSGLLNWTPGNEDAGIHPVTVTVSDGRGGTDTVQFVITVVNVNDPPELESIVDTVIYVGVYYYYQVTASDIDPSDTLFFYDTSDLFDIDSLFGEFQFTPDIADTGTHNVTIKVSDGDSWDSLSFALTIRYITEPPVLSFPADMSFNEDDTLYVGLTPFVYDPDNSFNEFSWNVIQGVYISGVISDSILIFSAPKNWSGNEELTLIVKDPVNMADTVVVSVTVNPVNDPPVLAGFSDTTIYAGRELNMQVEYSDADEGDTHYFYDNTALFDIGLTTGVITFTPLEADEGKYPIMIWITDGEFSDTTTFNLSVILSNHPPVITMPSDTTFSEDDTLLLNLNAYVTDSDDTPHQISWQIIGGTYVYGAVKDSVAEIFSDKDWHGEEEIQFIATDPGGLSDSASILITVAEVNDPPVLLVTEKNYTFNEDETLRVDVSQWARDREDDIHALQWFFGPDTNINGFVDNDLKAHFIPALNWYGKDTLNFSIADTDSAKAWGKIYLTVKPVNDAPVITYMYPAGDTSLTESDSLTFRIEYFDVDNDDIAVSWLLGDSLKSKENHFTFHNNFAGREMRTVKLMLTDYYEIVTRTWKVTFGTSTSINSGFEIPSDWELFQNFPNPFNNSTTIKFSVPYASRIVLDIYDLQGRKVKSLINADYGPGEFSIFWNGTNNHGVTVATGVYLMKLQGKDFIVARKILFLK